MKKLTWFKSAAMIGGTALLASGCVVHEVRYRNPPPPVVVDAGPPLASGEVVVSDAPPAPIVETVSPAPDRTFVWIGGVWVWQGRWVWTAGHWARPPRVGAVWIGPRYAYHGGRHVWVRGYWR